MGAVCSVLLPVSYRLDLSKFTYSHTIAEGGIATVHSVMYRPDHTWLVLKEMTIKRAVSHGPEGLDGICAELKALRQLEDHPFIVNVMFAFHDGMSCFLGMEHLRGGDLRYHLLKNVVFDEKMTSFIVACIGSALHFIHSKKIIHRDVKPENIILDARGYPRLVDFDISYIGVTDTGVVCKLRSGTKPYMAPEIFTKSHRHSFEADFWSLGVVCYELIYTKKPFHKQAPTKYVDYSDMNYQDIYWDRLSKGLPFEEKQSSPISITGVQRRGSKSKIKVLPKIHGILPPSPEIITNFPSSAGKVSISEECIDMMRGLLDVRLPARIGVDTRYNIFHSHPWFQSNGCVVNNNVLQMQPRPPFNPTMSSAVNDSKAQHYSITKKSNKAKQKFELASKMVSISTCKRAYINPVPKDIENKLKDYHYCSPDHTMKFLPGRSPSLPTDTSVRRPSLVKLTI